MNEQVKRNPAGFPDDFAFQLTAAEKAEVVANCDHLGRLKFSPVRPYAFTEQGAIMAANVLNSPQAVRMSVFVVRAFVKMRELLSWAAPRNWPVSCAHWRPSSPPAWTATKPPSWARRTIASPSVIPKEDWSG